MMNRELGIRIAWIAALFSAPTLALAHAFGQQYTLPLPVSFYITGGVAAFIASCALLALVDSSAAYSQRTFVLFSQRGCGFIVRFIKAVLLLFLVVGVVSGFWGSQEPSENILVSFFWLGLVLLVPYLSLIVGGWWEVGNPFKVIVSWFVRRQGGRGWNYGYTPALIGYLLLVFLELFFQEYGTLPQFLACALVFYVLYLGIGSALYGVVTWFTFADFFSVFFRLAGLLAPVRVADNEVALASPVHRLVGTFASEKSLVFFILFALAATAYDGFRETKAMYALATNLPIFGFELWSFIVFAFVSVLFLCLFFSALYAMKWFANAQKPVGYYASRFSFSLVPIMLAYHFAHYFPLLFSYAPHVFIGADKIWYIQLSVIVLGHAFAAYVAHRIALIEFDTKKQALLSQLPLLVLMVFYTAFGLWILSQPFASF